MLPELEGDVVRHVAAERMYLRVCVTPRQLQALDRLQARRLDAQQQRRRQLRLEDEQRPEHYL